MRIIALNCSPRAEWNTAKMLDSALEGAKSKGAEVKRYNLYKMNFKGCSSCFECLRLGGASYGRCAIKDELKPVLDDVLSCDGFFVGSPVYFNDVTACCRGFLERLWFAGLAYNLEKMVIYERRIPAKIILTTNAPEEGFHRSLNKGLLTTMDRFIGPSEIIEANNTLQFEDYSIYDTSMFDVPGRLEHHEKIFPQDLKKAYDAGVAITEITEL